MAMVSGVYILVLLDCNLDQGCRVVVAGQVVLFLAAGWLSKGTWLSRGAWSGTPGGSVRSLHLEALLSQFWEGCVLGRAGLPSGHDRS